MKSASEWSTKLEQDEFSELIGEQVVMVYREEPLTPEALQAGCAETGKHSDG